MIPPRFFYKFTESKPAQAALPLFLSLSFCFYNLWASTGSSAAEVNLAQLGRGSFLLAGLPDSGISGSMPLWGAAAAAAFDLGLSPRLLTTFFHFGVYLLVFSVGCLFRGYWAGVISLLAAGALDAWGAVKYDSEQSLYTFLILLVLAQLLLWRRRGNFRDLLLAGLATGSSLLVRTPLVLFPFALVFCGLLCGPERGKAFFLRLLLFGAASYALLLPWGALNYSVSGKFSLFDESRAACNLLTGARGAVYTMEGDARRATGVGNEESAFGFFVREVVADPIFYALTLARRLWQTILFYPLLFGLFLAALLINRDKDKWLIFSLPAYFILIHSFLSIEKRYFYPMVYALPPLVLGIFPAGSPDRATKERAFAEKTVGALFWLSFCAVLCVEALVIAYPYRSARSIADGVSFSSALERFPNDRIFMAIKCGELRDKGDFPGYYSCLGAYALKFGDRVGAYFLSAKDSRSPSELALPAGREMEGLIVNMLRELELGNQAAAARSFRRAYAVYERDYNMVRGTPYKRDRELASLIKQDSGRFWEVFVADILRLWPPGTVDRKLRELKKKTSAMPDFGLPGKGFEAREAGSKRLSDSAVEKMRGGDLLAAEKLLLEALTINPGNPEALMTLCSLRLAERKPEQAVSACRAASEAVYSAEGSRRESFEILAADAALISCNLLNSLGRRREAEATLRRAVRNAPAAWGGRAEAEKALRAAEMAKSP